MRSKVLQRILDETPKDVDIFVDLYADLVVRINEILREKGISKKQLAENLDKKPSEISKWLGGEHNFTLRSLAKLSAELDEPLLEVPKRKPQALFVSSYSRSFSFVVKREMEYSKATMELEWQEANEVNIPCHAGGY